MSTNFNLTTSSPPVNVIQSINYLLATQPNIAAIANAGNVNLGNVVQVSSNNAIFSNVGIIGYVNAYMDVKYANSATGSSGFTSNSTLANYYGVYNSPTNSESSNPVDYQWTQVSGGFGTTKGLYYTTGGGGTISFYVGSSAPNQYYQPVPDNVPIVLATISKNLVVSNSIQPQAVTNVQIATATITNVQIAANTITANNIQANIIFVNQSIQSSNATFGNNSSAGFWMDSQSGNVRFGGNTNIGTNLTVGNNAVIGGNLTVGGLITTGNLNSNTVITTTIVNQSVSFGNGISSTTSQTYPTWSLLQVLPYDYAKPIITTVNSTDTVYISGLLSLQLGFTSTGLVYWYIDLYRKNLSSNVTTSLNYTYNSFYNTYGGGAFNFAQASPIGFIDTPGIGTFQYYGAVQPGFSSNSIVSGGIGFQNGSLTCQVLKR